MDLKEMFLKDAVPVLATALMSLCGWGLVKLNQWVDAKAQETRAAGKNALLFTAISRVTHLTSVVVNEVEATVKADYEEAAKDGIITAEEGKKIKDHAVQKVLELLGTQGKDELISLLGIGAAQLPSYIGGLIELVVNKLNKPAGETTTATATVTSGVASPLASGPGGLPPSR